MILNEVDKISLPEVKRLALARKSKLQNLELHLRSLIAKKIRLELEIKHIQTVLKKKGKTNSKELRVSLNLEQQEMIDSKQSLLTFLERESPEILEIIQEGDQFARSLKILLEENNLINDEEAIEFDYF